MRLFLKDQYELEKELLNEENVEFYDVIQKEAELREKININYKTTNSDKEYSLNISPSLKIGEFKDIAKTMGEDNVVLEHIFYMGTILEDDMTFKSYGIGNNSVIKEQTKIKVKL